VGRASPRCAGLMRIGPKRAGPGRIATPTLGPQIDQAQTHS